MKKNTIILLLLSFILMSASTTYFANRAFYTDNLTGNTVFTGILTSKEYNCRNYINSTGVDVSIPVSNTYYTIKGMSNKHSTNISYTDSSITIPVTGWYTISLSSSGYAASNGTTPHISFFVDDIENTSFESDIYHKTAGESFVIVWTTGEMYLTAAQVVKAKIKYLADTGDYHINHLGFNIRKVN